MKELHYTARSPTELQQVAGNFFEQFLKKLNSAILLLDGELGAGKTTFTQGFQEPLGISETINSPTFNLLNIYHGSTGELYHYDLYRLSGPEEVAELGFSEKWEEQPPPASRPRLHIIEWWRRGEKLLPRTISLFLIEIGYNVDIEDSVRDVTIRPYG